MRLEPRSAPAVFVMVDSLLDYEPSFLLERPICGIHGRRTLFRSPGATASAAQTIATAVDVDAMNSRLIAAAEPFETLTERAVSASSKKLDQNIVTAERSRNDVKRLLSPEAVSELNRRLSEIRSAQISHNRYELALAAVEGYRILVSAAPCTVVPTAVSLLDYAGFRYQADLKSQPIRWSDMTNAVEFAKRQWDSISGDIADRALKDKFATTLRQMDTAVERKAVAQANHGVQTELNRVDKLESYFIHRKRAINH
jgi:hypothetical protein